MECMFSADAPLRAGGTDIITTTSRSDNIKIVFWVKHGICMVDLVSARWLIAGEPKEGNVQVYSVPYKIKKTDDILRHYGWQRRDNHAKFSGNSYQLGSLTIRKLQLKQIIWQFQNLYWSWNFETILYIALSLRHCVKWIANNFD